MANQDKSVINLQITGDAKQLEKVLKSVGDTLGKNLSVSLETSLVKAATKFAATLGKSMQASFDEGIVKALTKPIVLKIDTKDAQSKIDKLVDPLLKLSTQINKLESLASSFSSTPAGGKKQTTSSASSLSQKDQIEIRNQVNAELAAARKSLRTGKTNDPLLIKAGEDKIDKLNSLSNQLKGIDKSGAYTDAQINKLIKIREEIKKLTTDLQVNQDTLRTARAAFANSEATIDDFGAQIQEVVNKLGLLNVAEKDIDATTKKARNSFETLKEQFNLLGDELKKQSPNFALIERTIKNIQGRTTPVLQSRINTLSQNRQGIIDPAVDNVGKRETDEQIKRQKLLALQNTVTEESIEGVERALETQRLAASKLGPPLNLVNKQTSNYEKSLVDVRKKLQDVNTQFQKGEVTLEQAIAEYERLNKQLRQTAIGINQIDPQKLKRAFDLEQSDPRQLSYRLGILGFTLNTVSSSLVNFSRNTFNLLNQLAVFAEPIERVNNALALQVKQGQLTVEQQGIVLRKLRDIGDLPGSSVEDANATFNALQKVNVSLKTRLDLTEGIAKIAASPGGTPDSAKQFSDVIAAISLEKVVDEDRFKTLRRSGGTAITKLIDGLGFAGGKDIEEFGVTKFIEKVAESLNKLEAPAATTGDRLNRLKSRAAELGLVLGKILGPGLDNLNTFLKDTIEPLVKRLEKLFDNLSPDTKSFISTAAILVPVLAGIAGAFLSVAAAAGFAYSGIRQLKELAPIIKGVLPATAAITRPTSATGAALAGPLIGQVGNAATKLPAGPLIGLTGSAQIVSEGTKALGIVGKLGNALKVLSGPIGIIINLLTSVFTALFSNFNGVRDRLVLVFTQLDDAIDRLLESLGIGPGGLLKVLGFVGDAITGVFNTVGSVVLDVILSIVQAITSIINNLGKMQNALKDGNFGEALKQAAFVFLNTFLGVTKNLGINLSATLIDAVASAVEYIFGSGILSPARFLRAGADQIREFNATDKASILNNQAKRKELSLIEEQKNKEKKLAELSVKNDNARLERIKQLRVEIKNLTEDVKNDFEKFRLQQKSSDANALIDVIENNNQTILNRYKDLLSNLSSSTSITKAYNDTLKSLEVNQNAIISQRQQITLLDAKAQFEELTDPNGKLKAIFESVKAGDTAFKGIVDSISKVSGSQNLSEFSQALVELDNESKRVNPEGFSSQFYVNLLNVTERVRVGIAKNNKDTQKFLLDYKDSIQELKNLEIDRQANIKLEAINRKFQLDELRKQAEENVKNIKRQQEDLIREREGRNSLTTSDLENKIAAEDRLEAANKERREIKKQLDELYIKTNAEIEKAITQEQVDAIRQSYNVQKEQLEELAKLKEAAYFTEKKAYQDLYGEKNKNLILNFYSEIYNSIKSITDITSNGIEQIYKGFGKLFSSKDKNDNTSLVNIINNLISSGEISELSSTGDELKSILNELSSGVINFGDAYARLVSILSSGQSKDATVSAEKALRKLNKSIEDYNSSTGNSLNQKFNTFTFGDAAGEADLNKNSAAITLRNLIGVKGNSIVDTEASIASLKLISTQLQVLSKREGNISAANINNGLVISISKLFGKNVSDEQISSIYENIFSDLLKVKSEEDLKRILEILFKDTLSNTNSDDGRSEIILNIIEAIKTNDEARRKSTEAIIESELKISDSIQTAELQKIEKQIQDAELNSQNLGERILASRTSEERRNLEDQQQKIKLQLIDFNYQKLDIEEVFNTNKAIIQNKDNDDEIKRLKEAGLKRRTELLNQRNLDLKQEVLSSGGRIIGGKLIGRDGKEISISTPRDFGDFSSGTNPKAKNPILNRAESIITSIQNIRKELGLLSDEAVEASNSILDLFNTLSSGEGVINAFKRIIGGLGTNLKSLGKVFKNLVAFGVTAFADSLANALADSILNGESFLKSLGKFFGEILVTLGKTLVQLGIAALAMYALSKIPGLRGVTGSPDVSLAGAAIATAAGVGLMLAGKALGAGSAGVSNTGTTNTANSATGASGDTNYNPETDPLSIYQKALRAEIYLDIRTDDSQIIRSVVKGVNRNQKLSELIGNNRLGFSI